jgi:3-hydroxyisobutyrate dehydrogenase
VAAEADVLITVLADDHAVEDVCLTPEGTVLAMKPQTTHLEMSTGSAAVALRVSRAVHARGGRFLDAPVLGSGPQAQAGTLVIMAGGTEEAIEDTRDVLETLGKTIVHTGEVGSASNMKLVANQFIVSMMMGFAQGMTFARKAGLTPEMVMKVLDASALRSPFFEGKLKRLTSRDYKPNFALKWMLKDIDLMLAAGGELGVALPTIAAAREVYVSAMAQGLGKLDYSAIMDLVDLASGLQPGR